MNKVPVIAVSNRTPEESYYCYGEFFESLRMFGCEPVILGFGEPYRGMMSRLKLPLNYLRTIEDEHVIICDCWDLIFLRSPEDIVDEFKRFNAPIVISAEKTLFPAKDYGEYPQCEGDCRYLNAGFIVAEREALIRWLDHLDVPNQPDDYQNPDGSWVHFSEQELLHRAYVEQFIQVKLDHTSRLCQNMFRVDDGEVVLTKSEFLNVREATSPMAIHWNGPAKTEAPILPAEFIKWWKNQ